jgi:hypothetical protein
MGMDTRRGMDPAQHIRANCWRQLDADGGDCTRISPHGGVGGIGGVTV